MVSHADQKLWLAVRCLWWKKEETTIKNVSCCFYSFLLGWGELSHLESPVFLEQTVRLQNCSKNRGLLTPKGNPLIEVYFTMIWVETAQLPCNYRQLLKEASRTLNRGIYKFMAVAADTESLEISHISVVWREECVSNRTWGGYFLLSHQQRKFSAETQDSTHSTGP